MTTYCIIDRQENIVLENQTITIKENRTGQCAILQIQKEGVPIVLVPTTTIVNSAIEYEVEDYKLHNLPPFVTLRKECKQERRVENGKEEAVSTKGDSVNNEPPKHNERKRNKKKQEQANNASIQSNDDSKKGKRGKNTVVDKLPNQKKKAGRKKTAETTERTGIKPAARKSGRSIGRTRRKRRT